MSEVARHVAGAPSGLTDTERCVLVDAAVGKVMNLWESDDEDEARRVLGGYAEQERVSIRGDQNIVGLFVDGELLVGTTRAKLRAVAHPTGQLLN
jgi:hypothetical protein